MHAQEEPLKPDDSLPPELQALEAALASLAPRADRLDVDQILFEAGRQAARQTERRRRWSLAAVSSLASSLAATLLTALMLRPAPVLVERAVPPPRSEEVKVTQMLATWEGPKLPAQKPAKPPYLELREKVFREGLDAWPSSTTSLSAVPMGPPREPATQHRLREELLGAAGT